MQSILLPADIKISFSISDNAKEETNIPSPAFSYIKLEGPRGIFRKKRGDFKVSQIITPEGPRIFISGVSRSQESIMLSQLWNYSHGLSLGYRKRLRLVGIGFRGAVSDVQFLSGRNSAIAKGEKVETAKLTSSTPAPTLQKKILFPNYRVRSNTKKKALSHDGSTISALVLKLGYSHESGYRLNRSKEKQVQIDVSRLEGRTKGTVLRIQGIYPADIGAIAKELQDYRIPDIYKGKGIHEDGITLRFKKGKRQGLFFFFGFVRFVQNYKYF